MNYDDWRKKESAGRTDIKNFNKHQNILGFKIVKPHTDASRRIVSGVCYSPDCQNPYTKSYRFIVKINGPYCVNCVRGSSLIKQYPEIARSIVKCSIPISQLCCKTDKKVVFECQEKCLRCHNNHQYEMSIVCRVDGQNCSICRGLQKCPCQKDDEFKCCSCKQIKHKSKASYANVCKLCDSQKFDDNMPRFLSYLVTDCLYRGKREPRKQGDLCVPYVLNMLEVQQQRCYITGVVLTAGHHRNWKVSIDRVLDACGYDNMNVVLIATELQNGNRKWNMTLWDDVCSIVLGAEQYIPDETSFIAGQVQKSRKKTRKSGYKIQRQEERTNEDGGTEVKCKYCHEWLTLDKYQPTKIGYCKKCRKQIDHDTVENTLRGRALVCLTQSKLRSAKRKKDAVEHTLTFDDILDIYEQQGGRCYYSKVPLSFSGNFQMSLERLDPTKGYTRENSVLIILGVNAGDWSNVKHEDDERDERSGWTRDKLLFAVHQNPRKIVPRITYVRDVFET